MATQPISGEPAATSMSLSDTVVGSLNSDSSTKNFSKALLLTGASGESVFLKNSALTGSVIVNDDGSITITVPSGKALAITADSIQLPGVTDMDSDDTNVSTTLRNLTDLTQSLLGSTTYVGRLVLIANNSTGAEGLQFDCNGGTATFTRFRMTAEEAPIGATLGTTNSTAVGTPLNNTVVSTGDTAYCFVISLETNGPGTFIPRYAENSAHVTGVATIRRGSFLDLKVGP